MIRVQLTCDLCDAEFGSNMNVSDETIAMLCVEAASFGWSRQKSGRVKYDVCSRCLLKHGGHGGVRAMMVAAAEAEKRMEAADAGS